MHRLKYEIDYMMINSDTSPENTKWCSTANIPWNNDNIILFFYDLTSARLIKLPIDLSTIYWNLEFTTAEGEASSLLIDKEINKIFVATIKPSGPDTFIYRISNENGSVEVAKKINVIINHNIIGNWNPWLWIIFSQI